MTGQDVFDEFALRRDISDIGSSLRLQWLNHISYMLYRKLIKKDPDRFLDTESYSVSAAPTTVTLPDNFRDVNVAEAGLFEKNSDGTDSDRELAITSFGSTARGYYLSGSTSMVITGYASAQSFTLKFVPKVDALTDLDTDLVVPDEYVRNFGDVLDVLYSVWDEDHPAESYADSRVRGAIEELVSNIRRTARVMVIPNIDSAF